MLTWLLILSMSSPVRVNDSLSLECRVFPYRFSPCLHGTLDVCVCSLEHGDYTPWCVVLYGLLDLPLRVSCGLADEDREDDVSDCTGTPWSPYVSALLSNSDVAPVSSSEWGYYRPTCYSSVDDLPPWSTEG